MAPTQLLAFLPTADLEATHRFYNGTLGLELARDQGTCRIYRIRPGAFLGFCAKDAPLVEAGRVMLTLIVDDVAAWHAQLTERGARLDGPPRWNDAYAIEHFFATDPNGYLVEIQRFGEPLAD